MLSFIKSMQLITPTLTRSPIRLKLLSTVSLLVQVLSLNSDGLITKLLLVVLLLALTSLLMLPMTLNLKSMDLSSSIKYSLLLLPPLLVVLVPFSLLLTLEELIFPELLLMLSLPSNLIELLMLLVPTLKLSLSILEPSNTLMLTILLLDAALPAAPLTLDLMSKLILQSVFTATLMPDSYSMLATVPVLASLAFILTLQKHSPASHAKLHSVMSVTQLTQPNAGLVLPEPLMTTSPCNVLAQLDTLSTELPAKSAPTNVKLVVLQRVLVLHALIPTTEISIKTVLVSMVSLIVDPSTVQPVLQLVLLAIAQLLVQHVILLNSET